jgi:DNA helicase-2/ATP-dependent DNA helicase PcrA
MWGRGAARPSALAPARGPRLVDRAPAPPPLAPDLQKIRPGAKVRHPMFGVGTVVRSEGAGDDLKLTVSFLGVGAKRLVARYAGLEVL